MNDDGRTVAEVGQEALPGSHKESLDRNLARLARKMRESIAMATDPEEARFKQPLSARRLHTLRARLSSALDDYAPDAMANVAKRNPELVLRWLVVLEPKEVTATVRHEAVSVVMYPCEPPADWTPPLTGESLPVIDVPDVEQNPIDVGENEG
jgi:hypothetical protein